MKIVLFSHASGRLAIQLVDPDPLHFETLQRLLRPIPCRQWHPDEHLWTLPFEGPWASYFLTVLVRNGFQPNLDQLPRSSPLRRLGLAVLRPQLKALLRPRARLSAIVPPPRSVR